MHDEGRHYLGLLRHQILVLLIMGFVAEQTERLREKNPWVTLEQVCRALNLQCARVFQHQRQTNPLQHLPDVLTYHQQRNATASRSHKKRQRLSRF